MSRFVPVSPFKYIPASPRLSFISESKIVAVSMIVAIDTIIFSLAYPLVAAA